MAAAADFPAGHIPCDYVWFRKLRDDHNNKKPVLLLGQASQKEIDIFQEIALQTPQLKFLKMDKPQEFAHECSLFTSRKVTVYVCPPGGKTMPDFNIERGGDFKDKLGKKMQELLKSFP